MIEQIMIPLLSLTSVYLSQDRRAKVRRYACIAGLASQPFWFISSYKASQWGIFAASVLFTALWLRGFYNNWLLFIDGNVNDL